MGIDFEEEFKDMLLNFDDCSDDSTDDDAKDSISLRPCFVDIVLCIDVTSGMGIVLSRVKKFALDFYDDVIKNARKRHKDIKQLRVKVIAFRDYYWDGPHAMEESKFFILPKKKREFNDFVSLLEAKGGGDEPENALEAIALAMNSDWVIPINAYEIARNIIVVFTDASAHPLEKSAEVISEYYPIDMLGNYIELVDAWQGSAALGGYDKSEEYIMNPYAKRMIVYAPCGAEPWDDLEEDLEMMIMNDIKDLTSEKFLSDINSAIIERI
jgi:hypothetical protein